MNRRVLVAGVGNVVFGDDGFGVAVVERLARGLMPEGVVCMNAGIRGFDLTSALLDDYDAAVVVDTAIRGGTPGTLYVLDPDVRGPATDAGLDVDVDPHRLDPSRVLALATAIGAHLPWLRVVACEPSTPWQMIRALSAPVEAAVDRAVAVVHELVAEALGRSER